MMPLWLGGQQFAHRALVTEENGKKVGGSGTRVRVLYSRVLPVLGACACLVAVAAWLGKDAPKLRSSKVTGEVVSKSMVREPLDNPSTFPDFTVKRVLHSNLGGQGPDSGEPNIIYHIEASNMDDDLDLVMEALNPQDFKPWDVKKAGMWDKYQSVNIKGGSELHARFTFRNHRTHEPVTLPRFDMEFFDMDEQSRDVGREKITFHGQWTEYMLEKDALMSTTASGAHDEDLSFESTTTGTGSDNPADPDKLTLGEARKAFGITYRHAHSFDVTMSASAAPWPRFFIFAAKPSLLTLKSKDELDEYGEKAPVWIDLIASPEDEVAVVPLGDLKFFDHWSVKVGDIVKKGDTILWAKSAGGKSSEVKAPLDGTVKELENMLEKGFLLKAGAAVCIISLPAWVDLFAGKYTVAVVPPGELKAFDHWTVKVGDKVNKGDTILLAKSEHGKLSELKSPRYGTVTALEPVLQNGRLFKTGAAVAVIKVPPVWVDLIATKDERYVVAPAELTTFDHWTVKVGDVVKKGESILWAKSDKGFLSMVNATATGSVIALEPFLEKGRHIKTGAAVALIQLPVPGMNTVPLLLALALAAALIAACCCCYAKPAPAPPIVPPVEEEPMIAKEPVWIDLIASPEDEVAVVPLGDLKFFDHWIVKVGDIVKKGDTILWAKSAGGKSSEVKAPLDGTVKELENMLEKGFLLKAGAAVCIISLPAWVDLIAGKDSVAVVPPGELKAFDHWTVKVGDKVNKGDTILLGKSEHGKLSELKSPTLGTVTALEPVLQNGRLFKTGAAVAVIQEPKPYTITCEFEIADGSRTIVKFYQRPLGVTYNQTLPFTMNVISPGAEGHKRGVQTGWIIRRLRDGEDADWQVMDTEGDFEEANKELVGLIVKLPVAPKDPKT
ncbi:unnamed protein product [Polarella glacialis]|uniref:Uncharacterized protein n=1 Tax=Polarella glacialis TaxID=89957 RepID=A0A813F5Y8_POLGL|nr:unnamed protein product [Polarella glacialis]